MKARDLIIVGAVLALVGFAAFDAVRGDGRDDRSASRVRSVPAPTTENVATEPVPPEPEPLPRGVLSGTLLYVDVASEEAPCHLEAVHLRTGEEDRYPQDSFGCSLSVPPAGRAVAKSIDDVFDADGAITYRIIDPQNADRPFLEVRAEGGALAWSLDGRRALWCAPGAQGPNAFELELPRRVRPLDACASGYTSEGEPFFVNGRRLFVDGQVVLERPRAIDEVVWSANGSLALILGGRRLERWSDGDRDGAVVLPEGFAHGSTYFSPDNCAAAVLGRDVSLVDLGCFRRRDAARDRAPECELQMPAVVSCYPWTRPSSFFGHNANLAAWSPDGTWIAVIEADAIMFHRVVGEYASVRWEVRAATLAWR